MAVCVRNPGTARSLVKCRLQQQKDHHGNRRTIEEATSTRQDTSARQKMNSRMSRITVALAFGLLQWMHSFVDVPNDPEGLLIYHGSAALFDLAAIYIVSELLTGQLARDLCALTLASIGINGLGWLGYLFYLDPIWYDSAITSLIIVSYLRLFVTGGEDVVSTNGGWLVRLRADTRSQPHQKEAAL